jgi:hypothetical protein
MMLISLHAFLVTYAERDVVLLITYVNLYHGISLISFGAPVFPPDLHIYFPSDLSSFASTRYLSESLQQFCSMFAVYN